MSTRNWQSDFLASPDPEQTFIEHLEAFAERSERGEGVWRPGEPLRLLLAGYSGAGNVGTEMRTGEILRQLRHLLGETQVEFTSLSMSSTLPEDVLPNVSCLRLAGGYIPEVVLTATRAHHGTIACEGSMFKSTFANVLSAIMAGTLGMASRAGKLSVGYGAEVARMDPMLESFVRQQAHEALIVCRNEASYQAAQALDLRASCGTDTAWTFQAAPPARAEALLRAKGWNGSDRLLIVCPMNPFWWPVRPSPKMAIELQRNGSHRDRHFASAFFHAASPEITRKYQTYISQLAMAVRELCQTMQAFPVLVAMDRVDRRACQDLGTALQSSIATIIGCELPVADVMSVLRRSDLLVSSRFHALVGAMPAGVPSIGIAMDERIRNLLSGSGQADRLIAADDPDLGQRVCDIAKHLDRSQVETTSRATVGTAIKALGHMGQAFAEEVRRVLPDFPLPDRPAAWQAHVAAIPADVQVFLAKG